MEIKSVLGRLQNLWFWVEKNSSGMLVWFSDNSSDIGVGDSAATWKEKRKFLVWIIPVDARVNLFLGLKYSEALNSERPNTEKHQKLSKLLFEIQTAVGF